MAEDVAQCQSPGTVIKIGKRKRDRNRDSNRDGGWEREFNCYIMKTLML